MRGGGFDLRSSYLSISSDRAGTFPQTGALGWTREPAPFGTGLGDARGGRRSCQGCGSEHRLARGFLGGGGLPRKKCLRGMRS